MAKKKKSLSKAKEAAWSAMSRVVRYAAAFDGMNAACVTCGLTKPWKEQQAGHFIPRAQGLGVYFDAQNVAVQCYRCNINLGGNGVEYYRYMLKEYGEGAIDRLRERQRSIVKYTVADYEEMKTHYEAEFKRLEQLRADGVMGKIEFTGF